MGDAGPLPGRSEPLWLPLADGDRLAATLDTPARPADGEPLILLVHGLTGDENSVYMRESARWHLRRGRRTLRLNLRGAGRSRPFCRGHYHAGRAPDLAEAVSGLPETLTAAGLVAVGYSLGGAIVANWLALHADPATTRGAAAISAPLDPLEAAMRIAAPRNALYQAFLLRRMRREYASSPTGLSAEERAAAGRARTIYAFDDALVAPRNGYRDARDYYARTAAGPWLTEARAPLLILHADNDPWIPARAHREAAARPPERVRIVIARGGGHVGFHAPGDRAPWLNAAVEQFLGALRQGPRADL